jgi:hypothetical protein
LLPLIEGRHILALSFSGGMIMMLDFRLPRLSFRSQPVSLVMNQLMPWTMTGFAIMLITGVCCSPLRQRKSGEMQRRLVRTRDRIFSIAKNVA